MFKYNLPDENNSIIIIGANGSGKSKLGAWMEKQDMNNVHRISVQRSLNFEDYIETKNYEQSTKLLLYGTSKEN